MLVLFTAYNSARADLAMLVGHVNSIFFAVTHMLLCWVWNRRLQCSTSLMGLSLTYLVRRAVVWDHLVHLICHLLILP